MPSPETVTIDLSTPIQADDGTRTRTQLVLRRPTVKELRACGAPYRIGAQNGSISPDYEACAQLISMICAIPPSSVDQLDGADFDDIALRLVGFTKPAPRPADGPGSASAS